MAKRPKGQKKNRFFRFVFWTLVIVLLAPVGLIAAYRYVPPPVTPTCLLVGALSAPSSSVTERVTI